MNRRASEHRLLPAFFVFIVALVAMGALAADLDHATPAVLASSCANCHGPDGASPGPIPPINKLDAATLAQRLRDYRSGAAEGTVMNRIAKGYSDAEIDALAQYFSAKH
jgi:sulfide dehydrogenase cytochrome subunit